MSIASKLLQALGLFTTKAHPITLVKQEGIGGAAPKKVRKIGYGDNLRAARTAKQLAAITAQ